MGGPENAALGVAVDCCRGAGPVFTPGDGGAGDDVDVDDPRLVVVESSEVTGDTAPISGSADVWARDEPLSCDTAAITPAMKSTAAAAAASTTRRRVTALV
jgi:hypothetical protein